MPEARWLHTLTELRLEQLAVDLHGDQSAALHLQAPVIHPTYEARYFFKKHIADRDHWSRDLDPEENQRKHWYQQYQRTRRFVLYGGLDSAGKCLAGGCVRVADEC
jgi:hypothetical protein